MHRVPSGTTYQQNISGQPNQFNQSFSGFQKVEFNRANNSAFIPIKDGVHPATDLSNLQQTYDSKNTELLDHSATHNDSDELEINELLDILDNRTSSDPLHQNMLQSEGGASGVDDNLEERVRSLSVSFLHFFNFSLHYIRRVT